MPRKPRVEFEGAICHIMSRGNRQETIFRDDRDCETFLDTLNEACTRTGWLVHAYVLMGNHYHLLIETPEPNLVAGMKWLQGTYTQRFNARHKQWGHVLQGRYKALLVDGSEGNYFSTVSTYIHLNPARARGIDLENGDLSAYRWSSYPFYLKPTKRPAWLAVDRSLGCLGMEDCPAGRRQYREYMGTRVFEVTESSDPMDVNPEWGKIRRGWCFGGEHFRTAMLEHIESLSGKRESFSGAEVRLHDEREAEFMVAEGLKILGLNDDQLVELPKGADSKALLAWLVRRNSVVSNAWIADRLGMGRPDCLSRYPNRIEKSHDSHIVDLKQKLLKIIKIRD